MRALNDARLRLPILLCVAIAARALTFGNPVVHVDEEFYFVTAQRMWHGALPFVDIWDRKPVGLFLLYAMPAGLGFPAGIWAYQALALACTVVTAWLIARMAERLGYAAGATAAALAYILWLDLIGGQGGQSPVFYNMVMLVAALLIVNPPATTGQWKRGLMAMALVGVALQIKYSAVFEGIFFGLWLVARYWITTQRIARTAGYGIALVAVALAPTAMAAAVYVALGHGQAFLYANFLSIFHRNPDPLSELAGNLGQMILILSPIVTLAIVSLWRSREEPGHRTERRFVALWLGVAIGSVGIMGSYFDHYALPILLPACAAAAGVLGSVAWRQWRAPALLITVALAGQIVLVLQRTGRGDGQQLANLANAVGRGSACLYVYSGTTMLYSATGRCALSPYLMPSHLTRTREAGATGVDQDTEIRRILAAGPEAVVMRPPYNGERPAARAIVLAALARDYRLTAQLPMGNEAIRVYYRRR